MPEEARGKTGIPSEKRQKPERPRDLLGRPQPWGAVNQLEMPDFDSLSQEENHELGRAFMRERRFFPAHEAWEIAWKQARGTDDAEFFKGLSQMGAGYVHLLRGNAHGTVTLLRRASVRIGSFPDGHRGIRTLALRDKLEADAARVDRGALVPGADAAFEAPDV
jgi:hypothetical protein